MKTYRRAITAHRILYLISGKVADTLTARRLYDLRKKLDEAVDFVCERQKALMEQFDVSYNEVGQWIYPDAINRDMFDKANGELLDTEAEIEAVSVKAEAIPGLSIDDIAALDGFVEVEE